MPEKFYTAKDLAPINSGGAWNWTLTSNLVSFVKTAAADTTKLLFTVPRDTKSSGLTDATPSGIRVNFVVATAGLSSAPTATVNKVTYNATTRAISRAAITSTVTIAGTDTVGTSAGTYSADITFAPQQLLDNEALTVEVSFVAAATSALSVGGAGVLST